MAASKAAGKAPVGSAQWIQDENSHVQQLVMQEQEEFAFLVRNDGEWLNEHMAEIFSKSQMYVHRTWEEIALILVEMSPKYSRPPESFEARRLAQPESAILWRLEW